MKGAMMRTMERGALIRQQQWTHAALLPLLIPPLSSVPLFHTSPPSHPSTLPAMHFRSTLTALVAITLCSTLVAIATPADDASAAAPACFTACAAKSSADVGCSSATDASCFCTKEDFLKANARCAMASCPDVAMNTTLTMGSFKALETLCKKAIGAKNFNLTIPTMAELGMSMNASATASTSGSTSGSTHATTTTTSTDAAPSLQPPMAHVISACLVLSALVAGSSLIL